MTSLVERPKAVARAPKAEMGPLRELTPKHKLLIQYVVHGVDKQHLLDGVERLSPTEDDPTRTRPLKVGEPLKLEEAALVLGMRRKHARHLFSQQVFIKAYNAELESLRNGAKVDAIRKTIEIMNEPGDGSAAWAKVNLTAAGQILGEQGEAKGGVNVTVNTAIQLQPGIVIRLPASAEKPPLEIEGEVIDE
jgi:hypothetical protein